MPGERWFYALPLALRTLFRRRQADQELDEEIRYHVDQQIQDHIAKGLTPVQARTTVLRSFGGVERSKEECRDMRRLNFVDNLRKDIWHAVRGLHRSPGFTAIAVLTLAVGLGATTAIFSVVYGVLLKPLPFDAPERLVGLYHRAPGVNLAVVNQGPYTYFTYRDHQRAFEEIGAWESNEVTITGRGEPEHAEVLSVTNTTLPVLKVQPLLGRLFTKEDDAPGSPLRVILTYGYWQRRFGGARDVIGQGLEIDGRPSEIVGVLPSSFRFLRENAAVLLPMQLERPTDDGISFDFQVLGRLRTGVTVSQANADMARMIPLLPRAHEPLRLQPNVRSLAADVTGDIAGILWILLAAVGIVLLIACANVANLFLVRAEGRQQELAMRAALGASRGRIACELLSESVMLALAGAAIGLAFAQAGLGLLRRIAPSELPRVEEIGLDPMVLLFALIVSVLTGILFGIIPVLRFGTPNAAALKEGGRAASDSPGRHRTRNTLVVAEVALAMVLLIVSGLMIRTFVAMRQVNPGFTAPEDVQTFRVAIPEEVIGDSQHMARTFEQIAQSLSQVPGVVSVGLSSSITMDGEDNSNPLFVEQIQLPRGELPPLRRFKTVAPGYFETMGNRMVAGRSITWADIYQVRPVVVISENLAREYWEDPSKAIGRRVRNSPDLEWREIIGVVGNERDDGLNQPATAIVYWPLLNDGYQRRTMAYSVRSGRVGAPGFLQELQQSVWSVNSSLPLATVQTLDEIRANSMAQTSFVMVMLVIAASVALMLGVVGIYGVIAYIVSQRTREIGTRMALGAGTRDVRRLFLRHGLVLTLTGISVGVGVTLAVTRVMSALLFGVGRVDPVTYSAVALGVTAIALLATYLPARRASGIDPMLALRSGM